MLVRWLDAVSPGEVPSDCSIAAWANRYPLCLSVFHCETFREEAVANRAMTRQLERILAGLPATGKWLENPEGQPDDLAHDAFFHVRRFAGDEPGVFVRSIFSARLTFLKEVDEGGFTLDPADLELIDRGFADLLSCVLGGMVNGAPHVTEWNSSAQSCTAMQRWIHGHLIFAALSQGLILSFRSIGQSFRLGKTAEVQKWADLSISLLKASGAAFLFTGDFAPHEYEKTIRPSMSPPHSAIGLSGLMSADHRHLAQIIRDMRPVLKALADLEPERHDRIAEALADVYDRHIFVCERFVGARPSILTAGRSERSGPSLIQQFKTLRLKPFEHPQRTPRLGANRAPTAIGECPFKHSEL